jgi:hypothetical protein
MLAIVLALLLGVAVGMGNISRPSVWVQNRSAHDATFFVTDRGKGPEGWLIVRAHTTAHAGSDGLGIGAQDVRINMLSWRHEAAQVGPCAPGDYADTLSSVPAGASVRLLIDKSGQPSVSLAAKPAGLPHLVNEPLNGSSEDQLC